MPTNTLGATLPAIPAKPDGWRNDASKHGASAAHLNFDIPDALLAEVDFKWLMAGQGHRVDPNRFYADQAYTMDQLQLALRSASTAVRECAAYLLEQIDNASMVRRPPACGSGLGNHNAAFSPGPRPVLSLLKRRSTFAKLQCRCRLPHPGYRW